MEDYNNIIEGILYLKGDEGTDIKELSLILEISKKEAVEANYAKTQEVLK